MTLFELLAILIYLLCGIAGAVYAGFSFGFLGFPLGFIFSVAILHGGVNLLSYVERMFWVGIPPKPDCHTNRCHSDDYEIDQESNKLIYRCGCGRCYQKQGRRFMEVLPDGASKPYMKWVAFRGWRPDDAL